MNNISNNISTNKFESFTGALPIAPVKLSGLYKIFINKNNILYFDDYNGRRVEIDKSNKFLPQLANFLKTSTFLENKNKLKYGGFRYDKELTYHCPLYLNNIETLPKYFQVSRIENKTLTNSADLHKYNELLLLVDLKKIGLYDIFEEITNTYDYILNYNLDDSNITINGYSIIEETNVKKTFTILNNLSNQPYLEVLNNKILNVFENEKIIFPKFINIEFEFQYVNNIIPFNNFFGFFSIGEFIDKQNFDTSKITVSLKEYTNKIEYKQEKQLNQINDIPYIDIISVNSISRPKNKLPQLRLKIDNIAPGDYIKIIHPDNSVFFEYTILSNDIKITLRETLRFISNKLTNLSNNDFVFTSNVKNNIITIKSNLIDDLIEEFYFVVSNKFIFIDDRIKFCQITDSDILINNQHDENLYQSVLINNQFFNVIKYFHFDDEFFIRLENFDNLLIQNINYIEIYENKISKLLKLEPITYLSYNSNLISEKQYDKTKYVQNLQENFDNPIAIIAQEKYGKDVINSNYEINKFTDNYQYISEDDAGELIHKNKIDENQSLNDINILTILFSSPGTTALLTPNILNLDKQFYEYNGNLDYKLLDSDDIRFHWFLIKAQTPKYLENTISDLRYFTDKPKLTSRLILNEGNLSYCETIFLGVKYRLPQKYKNYLFATYLNFQDESHIELKYYFEIDNENKTIYLSINKYLDFIDLLKGAEIENESLIDLSFFYSVQEAHNTNSQSLYAFKTGGILLCDDEISVMYQNQIIKGWRVFDEITNKWYICLKRSLFVITAPLTELFPESGNIDFYVYSSVEYLGETHYYTSMVFTVKEIRDLTNDYLWCEDIEVKFFDTEEFFVNKYNPQVINQIFKVNVNSLQNTFPENINTIFGNNTVINTYIVDSAQQQFKLINSTLPLSLKKYYFEIVRKNIYDEESNFTQTQEYFIFPEFINPTWNLAVLLNKFNIDSFDDKATPYSKISLFDRNQLWKIIQDILKFDVRFKHSTIKQTQNIIRDFLLSQLNEYSNIYSIEIKNSAPLDDKFIKLNIIENNENAVIWKMNNIHKINKINRYNGPYLPYLKLIDNELEFQKTISTNRKDVLFNIYDDNFSGLNINATCNYSEVVGNITSSLYTKTEEINFNLIYPVNNLEINLIDNLKNVLLLEEAIINNKNEQYISNINNNIDTYIIETYIKWLLLNVYFLDSVKNELGQKIQFEISDFLVKLKPKSFYNTRFENVIFNFKRK